MTSTIDGYLQQKANADSLRHQLRWPGSHGYNLPPAVDLRRWMTEIEDQQDMGTCVANAIAGSLEYLYRRYGGRKVDVSRLFIDYNARITHRDWPKHRHSVIDQAAPSGSFETNRRAAIRGLQRYGFCKEELWPYDRSLFEHRPNPEIYAEASRRTIVPLKIPINIIPIKTCLAHQIPVLVGIKLSNDEADQNRGWIQVPETPPVGYHACLVVGYDDRTRHFIIRNSWGQKWGDQGYCYVPYQYLLDKRLVATSDAFWAIVAVAPRKHLRGGYLRYPNFTQYHLQHLRGMREQNYHEQHQNTVHIDKDIINITI